MRKSTKWFVYGIAILIIAAAILFVWVYPQLDRSAQQTIRDIQTGALADDTQTESPTVDDHTEADNGGVPTAAPEALAVGLRGVGETNTLCKIATLPFRSVQCCIFTQGITIPVVL